MHHAEVRVERAGCRRRSSADAVLAKAIEVDVGDVAATPGNRSVSAWTTAFVDQGLTVPRQVVRRLAGLAAA